MKKVLFLMFLLFLCLGTASIKAQVRIGGNSAPQGAAVLDLNADNTATPVTTKGALALPRVSLASATAPLNSTTPITGMLIYNTGPTLTAGLYFWNGAVWSPITTGSGSALTDTMPGGGLDRSGSTVGINTQGVTNIMVRDSTLSVSKFRKPVTATRLLLTADSVSVRWLQDGSMTLDTRDTLFTPVSVPVTWTKVLDTTITRLWVGYSYSYVTAKWIANTDFCYGVFPAYAVDGSGYARELLLTSRPAAIMVLNKNNDVNLSLRFVCYRPSA